MNLKKVIFCFLFQGLFLTSSSLFLLHFASADDAYDYTITFQNLDSPLFAYDISTGYAFLKINDGQIQVFNSIPGDKDIFKRKKYWDFNQKRLEIDKKKQLLNSESFVRNLTNPNSSSKKIECCPLCADYSKIYKVDMQFFSTCGGPLSPPVFPTGCAWCSEKYPLAFNDPKLYINSIIVGRENKTLPVFTSEGDKKLFDTINTIAVLNYFSSNGDYIVFYPQE